MLNNFEIPYHSDKVGERIFNLRARRMSSAEEELVVIEDLTEYKQMEEKLLKCITDLKHFNRLAVGRELRMIELKQEVNTAYERLEEKLPYDLPFV